MMDLLALRLLFILIFTVACWFFRPFGINPWTAGGIGAVASGLIILFELRVRALSLRRLFGAVIGSLLGIMGAFLFSLVLRNSLPDGRTRSLFQLGVLLIMTYVGLVVGANKGDLLNLAALGGLFVGERAAKRNTKILDTSAIIDGRIGDIAETGFLEGVLIVPEFVLRELQMVADSSDSSKRQRGRRGLDVLQRMRGNAQITVQIVNEDFPQVREVDLKLIELAKQMEAKIVTNDFNLNKVAQVRGVQVLNINDLANSLRPVVLPGEKMRVVIMKEGKEFDQGVGYLDDGTMVVVDHARRLIGRSVEICVTSVLQTASGKMIFGRLDEGSRPEAMRATVEAPNGETAGSGQAAGR
ncbi:MAG TPA: PIN domain-containing protein [Acidobacteriaceae bacterium]|jgi:uncharacterized protein YacL|nr:PIN domain-containing protein [Acidobacteriaceae bacterium]